MRIFVSVMHEEVIFVHGEAGTDNFCITHLWLAGPEGKSGCSGLLDWSATGYELEYVEGNDNYIEVGSGEELYEALIRVAKAKL